MAHLQKDSKGIDSMWGGEAAPPQHIWQLSIPPDPPETLQAAKHLLAAPRQIAVLQKETGSSPADTLLPSLSIMWGPCLARPCWLVAVNCHISWA